jgi:hypothetical protein
MVARNYSNIAADTELTSGINNTDTSLTVDDATGWPAAPFVLVLEPGTSNEELVWVGSKAGSVYSSCTRGYGGSTPVSHSSGAIIKHVFVAEDARLVYTHVHTAAGDHSQTDHDELANLTGGDPHTQYTLGSVFDLHNGYGGAVHPDVTGSVDGFMIAADKSKLDGVEAGAKDDQTVSEIFAAIDPLNVEGYVEDYTAQTLGVSSWTEVAADTFTLPAGWTTARIQAWGIIDSTTIGPSINARMLIGATTFEEVPQVQTLRTNLMGGGVLVSASTDISIEAYTGGSGQKVDWSQLMWRAYRVS